MCLPSPSCDLEQMRQEGNKAKTGWLRWLSWLSWLVMCASLSEQHPQGRTLMLFLACHCPTHCSLDPCNCCHWQLMRLHLECAGKAREATVHSLALLSLCRQGAQGAESIYCVSKAREATVCCLLFIPLYFLCAQARGARCQERGPRALWMMRQGTTAKKVNFTPLAVVDID